MVHRMDSGGRVLQLIKAMEDDRFSDPSDTLSELPHRTATSVLQTASQVASEIKVVIQALVDDALTNGATWAEIADALGLSSPSSAHYLYGPKTGRSSAEDRAEMLAVQRERVAAYRKAIQPKPELPGLSAIEAGRRLGVDRRTVKHRALRGEIESITVTSANGTETLRFLLPDDASPSTPAL